jgi:molybdopterin-guanine dinucleotide biosynthesis adapter protein
MPPVVSIVGKSDTGKTTFLEKLIRELTERGYRVASIKHSHHGIDFHLLKKDDWKHAQAGSVATVVSSTTQIQIIKNIEKELTVDEIVRHLGDDYDIVLTEGFSRGDAPKVEIHRKEKGPLLEDATKRIAIVTDEPLDPQFRQFATEDVKGVADLLVEGFIKPNRERCTFYVNGDNIPLSAFPRQFIINVLLALANSLKGVSEVRGLDIFYRKK